MELKIVRRNGEYIVGQFETPDYCGPNEWFKRFDDIDFALQFAHKTVAPAVCDEVVIYSSDKPDGSFG